MTTKWKNSRLHFSPADVTERGSLVKALRCASTADAAPEIGGLDKALFRAPVSAPLMGKMKKKILFRDSYNLYAGRNTRLLKMGEHS